MKKQIFIWIMMLVTLASVTGCNNVGGTEPINVLLSILTQGNGVWRVRSATFGNEEAPFDMFTDYRITFRADGSYRVVNPAGVPSFTRTADGKFTVADRVVTFDDGATVATEVTTGTLNPARLVFEFDVVLPGKSAARYRFELVK